MERPTKSAIRGNECNYSAGFGVDCALKGYFQDTHHLPDWRIFPGHPSFARLEVKALYTIRIFPGHPSFARLEVKALYTIRGSDPLWPRVMDCCP
ncbi:MAG: hypothetical protein ABW185_00940 [Sedimenticola sp.]